MIAARKVALLLLMSGCCALIYQTVWLREFRLIFGASTTASAAVLAIFMGGLGFGGILLGRRVERVARPLEAYAFMELAIAGLAAVSPLLLDLVRAIYLASGGSEALGMGPATVVRLVLSVVVLGPAVLLMGGTLPAAARAVTQEQDASRLGLALLYGLNTLGAVLGVLGSTFFLFEFLGFRSTLWVACLVNALVALLARSWARDAQPLPTAQGPSAPSAGPSPSSAEPLPSSAGPLPSGAEPLPSSAEGAAQSAEGAAPSAARVSPRGGLSGGAGRWLVLGASFVTGFVFLLLELVWYRLSSPILGGSTYTFGVILAVALLGIGLGGLGYSLHRGVRPSRGLFALTCALEAVLLLLPFALGDELPILAANLRGWGARSFGLLTVGWAVIAGLLALPTALVAGYQFPLMMALRGQAAKDVAKDVGEMYAANTLGSILGSLLGGFLLLPKLGAERLWVGCGWALLALGGAFLASAWGQERRKLLPFALLLALGVWFSGAQGPTALWRHTSVGAGRTELSFKGRNEARAYLHEANARVLESHEGVESSLAFVGSQSLAVLVNGKSDGDILADSVTTVGLGLVPALVHGSPKKAYVIGLASGVTGGWLAEVPGIERVDIAEIEPDMVRFAELSGPANFEVMRHPRAKHLLGDGRELLLTSQDRYDLIISEPSNPFRAGIANFYTREFYAEAQDKLTERGIFAQWVQGYEVDATAIQMIAKTMNGVFPHVALWMLTDGDFLFLASRDAMALDVGRVRAQAVQHPYDKFLGRVAGLHGPEGLAALHLADARFIKQLGDAGGVENLEDQPTLEFLFARSVGRNNQEELVGAVFRQARALGMDQPLVAPGAALDGALVDRYRRRSGSLRPFLGGAEAEFWEAFEAQDPERMLARLGEVGALPQEDYAWRLARLEALVMTAKTPEQLGAARREVEAWPQGGGDQTALRFLWAAQAGDGAELQAGFGGLIEAARRDAWLNRPVLMQLLKQLRAVREPATARQMAGALLERPFASYLLELERKGAAEQLLKNSVVDGAPDPLCAELLGAREPWPAWEEAALRFRGLCYERWNKQGGLDVWGDVARHMEDRGASLHELMPAPTGSKP